MGLADWLDRQGDEVGLAFTDVVRSTSLLFEEQTVRYADFLRMYRDRALARARIHGGRIVDETGDQVLAVFPAPPARSSSAANSSPTRDIPTSRSAWASIWDPCARREND